jgi:hypothetical protein
MHLLSVIRNTDAQNVGRYYTGDDGGGCVFYGGATAVTVRVSAMGSRITLIPTLQGTRKL